MQLLEAHEARLYLDQDMQQPELFTVAGGTVAVYSARCPGKPTPNEDAAAVLPVDAASAVLVVADGLGGTTAGERASALAVRQLRRSIAQNSDDQMLRTAILNGIEQANRSVSELGVGAATTLAVVEISEGTIRPYHVGDSMILAVGQRGRVKLQTVSHSPVGYAVEAGMLDEAEAMHHEDRHLVSNVIGTADMRIEIGAPLQMAPRDTLLLASDGLLDNLYNEEIIERTRKGPLAKVAGRLAGDCRERMRHPREGIPCKADDLTLVVFRRGA